MIETILRAASPAEHRSLEALARGASGRAAAVWPAAGAFLAAFLGGAFLARLLGVGRGLETTVGAACGLLAATYVYRRIRTFCRRTAAPHLEELAADRVEETRVRARDAIRVEESEDEGSAFYLLLEDGRVLFLAGQYLYDEEEDGRFPCTEFVLVRTPLTRLVLDLRCTGAPLPPCGVRPPFTAEEFRADRVPEDGAVLETDFDRLRRDVQPPRGSHPTPEEVP
ncbi:MAG TPA: hypothetical protein VHG51_05160 [Longimicrobiaceae bacterium]|nr:hypothetical protein [Longimicrobiaceae bacterium]